MTIKAIPRTGKPRKDRSSMPCKTHQTCTTCSKHDTCAKQEQTNRNNALAIQIIFG